MRSKRNPFKPFTIARSMLEPKYRANEADLFTHLPYVAAVTDTVISTRDGELIGTLLVKGIPVDTTEDRDLEIQATAFAKAIDGVEGTASFYVNKINTYAGADFQPAAGDDFAAHIDAAWCNSFQGEALINHYSLVTVGVRETATDTLINRFRDDGTTIEKSRAKLVDALNQILDNLETLFQKAGVERLTISSGKLFGYLSSINTAEYHPIEPSNNGMPIAAQLAERDILFKLTEFQTKGIVETENTVGAVLSMNKYAAPTEVGIYDGFFVPHRLVVTHSYIPVPLNVAMAKTTILYNQMNAAKSVTTTDQEHLKDGADRLGSGQLSFGLHHCTVAIHAANRDDLAKVISHIKNAAHYNGGSVRRDYGKAMCSMFFAQHPANQAYRTRFELANNHQFADMVAFHNQPSGRTKNLIWGNPLTHFKTATDSLYAFNLHEPQTDPKHFPVGHTLILGRTGTGKSVLAMFLAAQAQRLGTRIFCFDKKRAMEIPLRAMGVNYTSVKMGMDTGLNPFASETDERGVSWLSSFAESLVTYGSVNRELSPVQRNAIADAAKENAAAFAENDPVSFKHFTSHFNALDDDHDLEERFKEWTDGRFAWMFNGKGRDPLSDPEQSVAFDITELFDNPVAKTAWLGYVLRRIERITEDGKPTMIIIDEAGPVLDDPVFGATIQKWLQEMRKQNVVVILLTQRPEHITKSAAGDAIIGGVTTKMVFMTPENNPEHFRPIGFTDGELAVLQPDVKQRQALCVSSGDSVILNLDLSACGSLLDILTGSLAVREQLPVGWENNPNFWKELL